MQQRLRLATRLLELLAEKDQEGKETANVRSEVADIERRLTQFAEFMREEEQVND